MHATTQRNPKAIPRTTRAQAHRREPTLAALRGITAEEMAAGLRAGRTLLEAGQNEAAAEVLGGLALFDPYRADVWQAIAELFRRCRRPSEAELFERLSRTMAA